MIFKLMGVVGRIFQLISDRGARKLKIFKKFSAEIFFIMCNFNILFSFLAVTEDSQHTESSEDFDFEARPLLSAPATSVQVSFHRSPKYDRYYVSIFPFLFYQSRKFVFFR